ncbi:hypothetical protein GCM10022256_07790 [Frondihabitans peucedani]|uniref:Uncharacterized protein n=1 Tax=Frondihabitans peucedani TaxID=598626 RepID=A0ABP8DZ17_9MICO
MSRPDVFSKRIVDKRAALWGVGGASRRRFADVGTRSVNGSDLAIGVQLWSCCLEEPAACRALGEHLGSRMTRGVRMVLAHRKKPPLLIFPSRHAAEIYETCGEPSC